MQDIFQFVIQFLLYPDPTALGENENLPGKMQGPHSGQEYRFFWGGEVSETLPTVPQLRKSLEVFDQTLFVISSDARLEKHYVFCKDVLTVGVNC